MNQIKKILTGFSLRTLTMLLICIVLLFWITGLFYATARVKQIEKQVTEIKTYDRPILEAGEKTLTEFSKIKSTFLMAFLTKDPGYFEKLYDIFRETEKDIELTEELAKTRNDDSILEKTQKLRGLITKLEEKLSKGRSHILSSDIKLSEELTNLLNDLIESEYLAHKLAKAMLTERYKNLDTSIENQKLLAHSIIIRNIIIFAISLFIAILLTFWITNILRTEALQLLNISERVANKDLRIEVTKERKSNNEIHAIKRGINTIIQNIKTFIQKIQDGISHISSASEEFSTVVTQSVEHSQQAFQNVKDLLEYTDEVRKKINGIQQSLSQLTEAVNEISKNATETSQESDHAHGQVQSANEVLRLLSEEIQNISSSADLIQTIAEQTNLLALNATIEAARAGDAGKGFAVVANEVKELSQNSAKSAMEIRNRVQALITRGNEMEQNMQQLSNSISRTRERTMGVASAVEEQTAVISELAETLNNITKRMNALDRITDELRKRTEEAEQSTEDMRQGAEELAKTATFLQKEVNEYRVN